MHAYVGAFCFLHLGARQERPLKFGSAQVRELKLCPVQIASPHRRPNQERMLQLGTRHIRPIQLRIGGNNPLQLSVD